MNQHYFLVTSPKDAPPFLVYASREYAEAKLVLVAADFPSIGPWSVIELAPVTQGESLPGGVA